eukprot:2946525-Prymnesium_polylepis.1
MELRHSPSTPPAHAVAYDVGARHACRVEHCGDIIGGHRACVVRVVPGGVALAVAEEVEAQHAIPGGTRLGCDARQVLLAAQEAVE